jgi:hypothetical protein
MRRRILKGMRSFVKDHQVADRKLVWSGLRTFASDRRLRFEVLDARICPAVFYDLDVVAGTGANGLTDIEPAVSINDSGKVAFVASQSAGQSIYTAGLGSPPTVVSFANPSSTRTYGRELQINNSGQVAAIDIVSAQRRARIWDANSPGTSRIIASSSIPRAASDHFDGLGSFASLNNEGLLAFAGLENPPDVNEPAFWEVNIAREEVDRRDSFNLLLTPLPQVEQWVIPPNVFFRFRVGNGDRTVIADRIGGGVNIKWYDSTGLDTSDAVASTSGGFWNALGIRPGISDDGKIIAFYGDLSGAGAAALNLAAGPGIFAAIDHDDNLITSPVVVRIAGLAGNGILDPNETYADENTNGAFDSGTDTERGLSSFEVDGAVSVTRSVDPTTAGRVFHVAWIGTDSESSSEAIHAANMKIKMSGTSVVSVDSINAGRVIAVGDDIDGLGAVSDLAIHDAANGHGQLAFWASAGGSEAIVIADPRPPKVVVVSTHGFGNTWNSPIGQLSIPGFLDNWRALGNKFETLPEPGSPIHNDVASYVSNWNSSDGWIDAFFSLTSSIVLAAQGNAVGAARALATAQNQMVRAGQLAEQAASRIVSDLKSSGLIDDPAQTQNGDQSIQLVGHSRGAAVNAELARRLTNEGYVVQDYISLDGYSTDWPGISGILGDISIQEIVSSLKASGKLNSAISFRVQDGLDEAVYDYLAQHVQNMAHSQGIFVEALTAYLLSAVRAELPSWRAPERSGFDSDSDEEIVGGGVRSHHVNVVDIYLEKIPGARRYLLDSYVGENSSPPPNTPVMGIAAHHSGGELELPGIERGMAPAFTDGDFSLSEAARQEIEDANLFSNGEPFIQAWSLLNADPAYAIGTFWQTSGAVELATINDNPAAKLNGLAVSSLSQAIDIPVTARSIDFDLEVLGASGERFTVLVDDTEIGSLELSGPMTATSFSMSLDDVPLGIHDVSLVLHGSGSASNEVLIDNIRLVLNTPTLSADFDADGDVDGSDFLEWQRGLGSSLDASDLVNWQTQFGSGGGLALARSSESLSDTPDEGNSSSSRAFLMGLALAAVELNAEKDYQVGRDVDQVVLVEDPWRPSILPGPLSQSADDVAQIEASFDLYVRSEAADDLDSLAEALLAIDEFEELVAPAVR